eukprot:comp24004_c1_seq1/m.42780 comp24004_c1_seq1/g.42780  ORF comp24004_c1_seq1/g.42780 comp24004_c1_seq1/m.42780 type:complete len:701 (-) comp24004_c1_seq1:658-2760(-)
MATRKSKSPKKNEGFFTSLLQSLQQLQIRPSSTCDEVPSSTIPIPTTDKGVTGNIPEPLIRKQKTGAQQARVFTIDICALEGNNPPSELLAQRGRTNWVQWSLLCVFVVVLSIMLFSSPTFSAARPVFDTQPIASRLDFQENLKKSKNDNGSPFLPKEQGEADKPTIKVLEQLMQDAAYLPGVGAPFVDLSAGERCDVIAALDSSQRTDAARTHVHVENRDGIITAYLRARDNQGSYRTHGGDVFRCTLVQTTNTDLGGIVGRAFRAFAYSYDHCNGTYTCTFDMRHGAAGIYNVSLLHLSRSFTHIMSLMDAPKCGAAVASRYIDATHMLEAGTLTTQEISFPNTTVAITPKPLSTSHLPPCTMASPSTGRWVAQSVCFPGQKVAPTWNETAGGCRRGDVGMRVHDASVWVPFSCALRYVSPGQFAQQAWGQGHRRFVFLGDSRSYNLWLSFGQFVRGTKPDPVTGTFNQSDLITSLPLQKPRICTNTSLCKFNYDLSLTAHNITFDLFTSFGTADHMDKFPCPEFPEIVTDEQYHPLKRTVGTWFEKFQILLSSSLNEQPDVIILQDGGLHDFSMSLTETYYVRSIKAIINSLKAHFPKQKIIYVTLPAAHAQHFTKGFSVRSEFRQWRRAQLGQKLFSEAGFDVWDIHHMTASRADRYFDKNHFYPQPHYPTKWHEMPMLLAHELVQDLLNRMYEWP